MACIALKSLSNKNPAAAAMVNAAFNIITFIIFSFFLNQAGSPFQATAIRDVTLSLSQGELTALIGHTGSGKSTLAQHMNALLAPTSGRVLLDGKDINQKGVSKKETRQRIGLVFQYAETQLFEETVAKDIAFGPKNLGLSQEETDARVKEALHRVGLPEEVAEKSPFELSGGQMRRAAIAGVIAMRPEMLVLDEPAAGLDPMGREDMLSLVRSFHEAGTTVVMISHSMDDVARLAKRIIVMDRGKVALDGTAEEVFQDAEHQSAEKRADRQSRSERQTGGQNVEDSAKRRADPRADRAALLNVVVKKIVAFL